MEQRFLVTVINTDDSVFTYGVTTIGGKHNAIEQVRSIKTGEYFIYAKKSDEKADYEINNFQPHIPDWIANIK